jgi:phage anti-repressor protein
MQLSIVPRAIGAKTVPTVSLRDLHGSLCVSLNIPKWLQSSVFPHYISGLDYEALATADDYAITLQAAKEIAHATRTPFGQITLQEITRLEALAAQGPDPREVAARNARAKFLAADIVRIITTTHMLGGRTVPVVSIHALAAACAPENRVTLTWADRELKKQKHTIGVDWVWITGADTSTGIDYLFSLNCAAALALSLRTPAAADAATHLLALQESIQADQEAQ